MYYKDLSSVASWLTKNWKTLMIFKISALYVRNDYFPKQSVLLSTKKYNLVKRNLDAIMTFGLLPCTKIKQDDAQSKEQH